MDSELLIPLIWMGVFGTLIYLGVKNISKKLPIKKKDDQ